MCRSSLVALLILAVAAPAAAQDCRSPDLVVTLDASGSMRTTASGGQSRWEVAVDGLAALTRANDETVRWGLVLYPSDGVCDPGAPVALIPTRGGDIGRLLAAAEPDGGTPTAVAVDLAASILASSRTDRPQYHVLVTDGDANCNTALSPSTCTCTCTPGPSCDCAMPVNCLDDVATEAAITSLALAGVPTFVISFLGDPSADVLNRLAIAGGTAREGDEKFIRVARPQDFVAALSDLEGLVGVQKRACDSPCGTGTERCTEEAGWIGCDAPSEGSYRGCAVDGEAIGFQRCEADGWGPCEGEAEPVEEGCGCGAGRGGAAGALGWLAGLLLLALRRRR